MSIYNLLNPLLSEEERLAHAENLAEARITTIRGAKSYLDSTELAKIPEAPPNISEDEFHEAMKTVVAHVLTFRRTISGVHDSAEFDMLTEEACVDVIREITNSHRMAVDYKAFALHKKSSTDSRRQTGSLGAQSTPVHDDALKQQHVKFASYMRARTLAHTFHDMALAAARAFVVEQVMISYAIYDLENPLDGLIVPVTFLRRREFAVDEIDEYYATQRNIAFSVQQAIDVQGVANDPVIDPTQHTLINAQLYNARKARFDRAEEAYRRRQAMENQDTPISVLDSSTSKEIFKRAFESQGVPDDTEAQV